MGIVNVECGFVCLHTLVYGFMGILTFLSEI